MSSLNEMANYTDLTVEKKLEGAYLFKRVGMIAAYIIVSLAIPILLMICNLGAIALIIYVPVWFCFLLPKLIVPATFRYVQIEYAYTIKGGELTVEEIFGRKTRKELAKITVSAIEDIAPYSEWKPMPSVEVIDATASLSHPDDYYARFTGEDGKERVIFFQATNKAVSIMKFLNKEHTTVKQLSI